jgi:hypothetical protein
MDLDYCDDDIYSDPMNGQNEQDYYLYGHGTHFLRRQLVSLCDQKITMRTTTQERIIKN